MQQIFHIGSHTSAAPLLTSAQVSQLYNEHPTIERRRRIDGTGAKYLKIGAKIRYRIEDVNAWLAAQSGTKRGRGRPRKQAQPATASSIPAK